MKKYNLIIFILFLLISAGSVPLYAKATNSNVKISPPPPISTQSITFGNLTEITNNSITFNDKNNKVSQAAIDKNTKFIGKNKRFLKLKELKPNDIVAVISTDNDLTSTSGAALKKTIKIFVKSASDSAQTKRQAVYGIISNITGKVITLTHPVQQDKTYTVVTNSQTIIKVKGVEDATLQSLQVDQRISAVGTVDTNGVITAKRIHVIPGLAKGLLKKHPVSSSSAGLVTALSVTITATPSASISATPSPITSPSAALSR